eukprot:CAMPEP_0177165304 /NCGR_PEP_ID=MMETSP0367-20130122/7423_1 /TAXON_ID=447022 ORGANISM="Scrippsiella hangoei-like, Strain SHHI-4" /NCGR_SAMPLE_ID=MMETSP0367 /ASSEMBLY_ACC=CAM_ASM_000362 /LENGTH=104 /DNA_ID=CAMNT_0018611285 /DNA_START=787 /DNA_END=1102 /DNA_ORIENTATION=+
MTMGITKAHHNRAQHITLKSEMSACEQKDTKAGQAHQPEWTSTLHETLENMSENLEHVNEPTSSTCQPPNHNKVDQLLGGQAALLVGDGDLVGLARGLVLRTDV